MFTKLSTFLLFVCFAIFLSACQKQVAKEMQASPDAKRYELKGKVLGIDKSKQQITVAHEEVKDFMDAMTMEFKVKDVQVLNELNAGDMISATLVIDTDSSSWLEGIVISRVIGGTNQDDINAKTGTPDSGTPVPNFQLVNQDGKKISLDTFKGKYLVLTFIYTRCPIPDQCPLMSNNFAVIHNEMLSDKTIAERVHLLSITFDPKNDTPKVMRSYGASRTGRFDKEDFKHWDFVTGTDNEIQKTAAFYGLYYTPANDQIVHSLRTAIITPDGKIQKVIRGNTWKPAEVVQELRGLIGAEKK